jgi:Fe-S cluster biogenesis protein NfuA
VHLEKHLSGDTPPSKEIENIMENEPGAIDRNNVQSVLDEVRPTLVADGGDVELIDVSEDGTVRVRLIGACQGCPMSQLTLAYGIERTLRERISESIRVEAV